MTHLFNRLAFPPYSRITGIWAKFDATADAMDGVVTGHLVAVPVHQDGEVESDFLSSHLPFAVGGFSGRYPDGSPWVFVLQAAPDHIAARIVGADDPYWPLLDSLDRALRLNEEAEVVDEVRWVRDRLLHGYAFAGVSPDEVADWPLVDLVRGLLTECCYVDLADVVAGYLAGCAFPETDHDCTGNVFTDVFKRWADGSIPQPAAPPFDEDDIAGDDDDEDEEYVSVDQLMEMPWSRFERLAQSMDVRTRKRKSGQKRSRARIIAEMLEASD